MIIVICGKYKMVYDDYGISTEKMEFGVSHGYNTETGRSFSLSPLRAHLS